MNVMGFMVSTTTNQKTVPVKINLDRMQSAMASETFVMPKGLSREEKRRRKRAGCGCAGPGKITIQQADYCCCRRECNRSAGVMFCCGRVDAGCTAPPKPDGQSGAATRCAALGSGYERVRS